MAMLHPPTRYADGDTFEGEPVVLRASLSPVWLHMRNVTNCIALTCGFFLTTGFPFCGLGYCLCGGSCRKSEYDSFQLVMTPSALYYTQKTYSCLGCCCQTTIKKTLPLEKIQDVTLISDCYGDCCGFAAKGKPWRIKFQTAGAGVEQPELTLYCLEDMEGFRSRVLAAKRMYMAGSAALASTVDATGAAKVDGSVVLNPAAALVARGGAGGDSNAAVVAVLERIERALNSGIPVRVMG